LVHILHCFLSIGTIRILREGKRAFPLVADLDMLDCSILIKLLVYFVFIDGLWQSSYPNASIVFGVHHRAL